MKFIFTLLIILLISFHATPALASDDGEPFFIENIGQWDSSIKYLAQLRDLNVWITNNGATFDFYSQQDTCDPRQFDPEVNFKEASYLRLKKLTKKGCVINMSIGESEEKISRNVSYIGRSKLATYYNYFIGDDSSRWACRVPLFKEILIKNIYDGVDIRFYFVDGKIRYDYIIAPDGDVSRIATRCVGQDSLAMNESGRLDFFTSLGIITHQDLRARQDSIVIPIDYKISANGSIGFAIGEYDHSRELIIDPLVYSTYISGSQKDVANEIVLDTLRNAYIAGITLSSNFPTTIGSYDGSFNSNIDAFISELNPSGSALVFSTFFGGSGDDQAYSLALDSANNIYFAGSTCSNNFPTNTNAYDRTFNGTPNTTSDAFVAKLNSSGSSLIYSTYVGGYSNDVAYSIALDKDTDAYIAGSTYSPDFPHTSGAFDTTINTNASFNDGFVLKLNSSGSAIIYSTFIGGDSSDPINDIAVDRQQCAYITGFTESSNFPTTAGAIVGSKIGICDVFVTKFNQSGSGLIFSTLFGGDRNLNIRSGGNGIAIDTLGNSYITGWTNFSGFPTKSDSYCPNYKGIQDCFVTKINSTGSGIIYSTFLGGNDIDQGHSIDFDTSGNVYVTGLTFSTDFPFVPGGYSPVKKGYYDAFITKLNYSLSSLFYSSFLGGSDKEVGNSIVADILGYAYCAGGTTSTDFPTTSGAFQTSGSDGAFVSKVFTKMPRLSSVYRINFNIPLCEAFAIDTFWVKNTGETNAIISGYLFHSPALSDYTLIAPTVFPDTIAPNDSIRFIVKFYPSAIGNDTASLDIINSTNTNPYTIDIACQYYAIDFKTSADSTQIIDFGTLCSSGISEDTLITITNLSSCATKLNCTAVSAPFSFVGVNPFSSKFSVAARKVLDIRLSANEIGDYIQYFTITDTCGKQKKYTVKAKVSNISLSLSSDTNRLCYAGAYKISSLVKNGRKPYSYVWKPSLGLDNANIADPVASPSQSTKYYLTVIDSIGCQASDSIFIFVNPKLTINMQDTLVVCPDSNTKIPALVSGGTLPLSYEWSPATGLSSINTLNAFVDLTVPGTYKYVLKVQDYYKCEAYDTLIVKVRDNQGISATKSLLDFGSLGVCESSKEDSLIITNNNAESITITNAYISQGFELVSPSVPLALAGKASQKIIVRFAGSQAGLNTGELAIFGSPCSQNIKINLSGSKYQMLVESDISSINFGSSFACDSVINDTSFYVRNYGNSISTIDLSKIILPRPFTLISPKKTISLNPKDSVLIKIRYDNSIGIGEYNSDFNIPYQASACKDSLKITLSAQVLAPTMSHSVSEIDFPTLGACESGRDTTIIIKNTGIVPLQITAIEPQNIFAIIGALPITIYSDDRLKITVRFSPIDAGAYSGKMILKYSPCDNSDTIIAKGYKSGAIYETPTEINFGDFIPCKNDSISKIFSITVKGNNGENSAISAISFPPYFSTNMKIGDSLKNGVQSNYYISLKNDAGLLDGEHTENFGITLEPCSETRTITLKYNKESASLISKYDIIVFDSSLACETISRDTAFYVYNNGSLALNADFASASISAPFKLIEPLDTIALNPKDSVKVRVAYNSPKSAGDYSKTLVIPYFNEYCAESLNVRLSAKVAEPVMTLNLKNIDFQSLAPCENYKDTSIEIENTGNTALSLNAIEPASVFSIVGSLPITIEANAKSAITIRFTPQSSGSYFGSLVLTYSPCDKSDTILISGAKNGALFIAPLYIELPDLIVCRDDSIVKYFSIINNSSAGIGGKISNVSLNLPFETSLAIGDTLIKGKGAASVFKVFVNKNNLTSDGDYFDSLKITIAPCGEIKTIPIQITRKSVNIAAVDLRFEEVAFGKYSDKELILINNGTAIDTIESISGLVAPFDYVAPAPTFPIILNPNETLSIALRYTPKSLDDDSLDIAIISAEPCNIISKVNLFGSSKIDISAIISVDCDTGKIGESIMLGMKISDSQYLKQFINKDYTAVIGFESSVLYPEMQYADTTISGIGDNLRYIIVGGKIQDTLGSLNSLAFKIGLGKKDYSEVKLENFYCTDFPANKYKLIDGCVYISDICRDGGSRLVNAEGLTKIIKAKQKESLDALEIEYQLRENAETSLEIYNALGESILTVFSENKKAGEYDILIPIKNIASGVYFIVLKTNNDISTKPLMIIK